MEDDGQSPILAVLSSSKTSERVAGLKEIGRMGVNGAYYMGTADLAYGALAEPNASVKVAAIEALSEMGPMGMECAQGITAELESQDTEVRVAAVKALGKLGCEESLDAIEKLLDSRTVELQAAACAALGALKATKFASKIASCIGGDVEVTLGAIEGLGALELELDKVAGLMTHQDSRVRSEACLALTKSAEKYSSKAISLLSDSDAFVRNSAMYLIAANSGKNTSDVPTIGALLSNGNPGVKVAAALALGSFGEASASQADALAALLTDTTEDTDSLPQSIAGIREKFPPAHRKPACAAAEALGAAKAKDTLPALVQGLNAADPDVKAACCTAIGQMGSPGAKYEDQLMLALEDSSPMVVKEACIALGLIAECTSANPSAAEKVAEKLTSKHPGVKGAALKSLGKMKDEANAYIEDIVKCCDDPVGYVRCCSIDGIVGCGELGQMYASKVCKLLLDPLARVKCAALTALTGMGERGAGFTEEVATLLCDESPEVRKDAVVALISFGSESFPYLNAIQELADADLYPMVREAAAGASDQIRAPAIKNKPETKEE